MISLSEAVTSSLDAGRSLVVPDARRAGAVRLAYASVQAGRGRMVWRTPDVVSWTGWLDREIAAAASDTRLPRALAGIEAWLLWRQSGIDAARSLGTAASDALIDALRSAADLAADWLIPVDVIARGATVECAWLSRSLREFEERSRDFGAALPAQVVGRLERARAPSVSLEGFTVLAPAQRKLLERWYGPHSDFRIGASSGDHARVSIARAADASDELAWAAEWARRHLLEAPHRRLLVVVPNLDSVRPLVRRLFEGAFGEVALEGGERLATAPLVRHAVASLRFPLAPFDFDVFSAWLRAPFWLRPDAGSRARLDLWLRRCLDVRVSWAQLARRLAEPPPDLKDVAGELRHRIELAAEVLSARPASASVWAERIPAALSALGFPGPEQPSRPSATLVRLRETLNELARLDRALGDLTHAEALDWLERLLARATFENVDSDAPVTITGGLSDPVVRYDGIWVTGLTAASWPAPVRRDPFIPTHAQLAAGVPAASAPGQLASAQALLAAWRAASDELVLSWPSSADDCEQGPSPLLAALDEAGPLPRERELANPARTVFAAREIEAFEDQQGEPWPSSAYLPGGSRSVEHQIRCAFRAYAELRLRATPLERPHPGLDPRDRGRLAHRALQLLWDELRDSATLTAMCTDARRQCIARSVERAADELLAEAEIDSRTLHRERRRLERLIFSLCEIEATRSPFAVIEREARRTIEIDGARLNVRIDRMDRLEDGRLALIDYKTGAPQPVDWLGERPAHPQLLVYLRAVSEEQVAALATAHLAGGRVAFRGASDRPGRVPKAGALGRDAWPRQLASWKQCVDSAVRDFAAGRARRDPVEGACTRCHLHAFCRIEDAVTQGTADE